MSKSIPGLSHILEVDGPVAIVGSSPKVLGTGHGGLIDECKTVFRLNRSPTDGYEEDVGSRTDVRLVNAGVFKSEPHKLFKVDVDFIRRVRDTTIIIDDRTPGMYGKRGEFVDKSNTVMMMNHSQWRRLALQVGKTRHQLPTAGFILLTVLIHIGFTPRVFAWSLDNTLGHYWEPRPEKSDHHDINEERTAVRRLKEEGKFLYHG